VFVLGGTPVSAQLGRSRVLRLLKEAEEKTGIRGDAPLEAHYTTSKLTAKEIGAKYCRRRQSISLMIYSLSCALQSTGR
jgi:hypothetical protein